MKGLITICARGGSEGIPGKNIKIINKNPLIAYTIKLATEFKKKYNFSIFLSTDSDEIKNVVVGLGATDVNVSYRRPRLLASSSAGKLDTIIDLKKYAEQKEMTSYDFVIDLDVTSPLRTVDDLEKSLDLLMKDKDAVNLFSVSKANRNPYFNMVEENPEGYFELCKNGHFLTRQSAPKVFDMNASFYIFKNEFFNQNYGTVITDKSIVYEVPHLCFDLDHPIDFEFMSFLMEYKKLDFDFIY